MIKLSTITIAFMAIVQVGALEIVLPAQPTLTEKTAKTQLEKYLASSVKKLTVADQEISAIHLGDTPLAVEKNLTRASMSDDHFKVRQFGDTLIINGGGTRGILYGLFNFLENTVQIRFWSPVAEYIPAPQEISCATADLDGNYFFEMRDVYLTNYPKDGGLSAIKRGFSRDGDRGISPENGGAFDYGPPYFCHTFEHYIPANEYLKTNPEFFSLVKGKRIGGQVVGQLCLTNPELRKLMLEKLLNNIAKTNQKAAENQITAPKIYDISHNDNVAACECENCALLAQTEGQSGVMLDFVNFLADHVAKQYPEVKLQTFAYQYTLNPPTTIKPRPNVIVRLCNTYSDQISGGVNNPVYADQMKQWAKIAPSIYVWDYAIIFGDATGLPFPSEKFYPEVYKFYADNGVTGMFWEQEEPDRSDMAELKYYLHSKYMQDPYRQDYNELMEDFCNKFYGKAGKHIIAYRKILADAAAANNARVSWFPTAGDFRFIDYDTMIAAQEQLDSARASVAQDELLLYRVNRAGMGLDRLLGFELLRDYKSSHKQKYPDQPFPFDEKTIRDRFFNTWEQSMKLNGEPAAKDKLMARFKKLASMPTENYKTSPKFAKIKHVDFPSSEIGSLLPDVTLQIDPEAETGSAMVINVDGNRELYKYPVTMGVYNVTKSAGVVSREIFQKEVGGPGYFWYSIPNVNLPQDDCYMYLSQSWGAQLPLNSIGNLNKNQPLTIHVRMKLEGSLYFGGPETPSRIYIDRVVITQGK